VSDTTNDDSNDSPGESNDNSGEDDTEQAEATEDNNEDGPVGKRVNDYITDRTFADFPLSPEVLQAIEEKGYKVATAVQAAAIDPALAGKDLVVRSKTGTGKTAAFAIPMIERIAAGDHITRAIVLAPTRELAGQVARECADLAKYKDIRTTVIYGGVAMGPQEKALEEGCEIVVGTPGRILDHIRRGNLDLSKASFACLDEADEMLSMGFFEDVSAILNQTPDGRQCLFFSATVDERVRSLIHRYAKDPVDLRMSTDTDKVEGIEHILYETSPDFHKVRALVALLDQEAPKSAIIFCNTRDDTATVATYLSRQGMDAEILSGELPQNKREQVMARVRKGQTQFLCATDVAARGIDISNLTHVVNYSLPNDPAIYLHRTGRTGRIGKKGVAISLVGGADMNTRNTLERQYEINFDVRPLPTADEAARIRVEDQARTIKEAMGTMAFEGYLSTVKAIRERPDADILFAAALRAFFLWNRMRKAELDQTLDSVGALQDARDEKRQRRRDGDGDGGGNKRRRPRRRRK
jgi:ATP-dependent RNA helicase DeaD